MVVIIHQTIGVAEPVKAVNDFAEDLQEGLAVDIFVEDILSRVAARGHMIQRAVKFQSERTSHDSPNLYDGGADTRPDPNWRAVDASSEYASRTFARNRPGLGCATGSPVACQLS